MCTITEYMYAPTESGNVVDTGLRIIVAHITI
jgi:hypothetical protein